jgi:hypothetical protein
MKPGATSVVVNGWSDSFFMRIFHFPMRIMERLFHIGEEQLVRANLTGCAPQKPAGTFVHKLTAASLKKLLGDDFPIKIHVWRSVSVRFLRAMIQPALFGRFLLNVLFFKEELFPGFFGEQGQYPLITFWK